jgi:predicted metal-dependent hydrolase
MINDDKDNNLLLTFRMMLLRNFELTKKFLTEKNAELEMVFKIRDRKQQENERKQEMG